MHWSFLQRNLPGQAVDDTVSVKNKRHIFKRKVDLNMVPLLTIYGVNGLVHCLEASVYVGVIGEKPQCHFVGCADFN